jgi:hypothetical protein
LFGGPELNQLIATTSEAPCSLDFIQQSFPASVSISIGITQPQWHQERSPDFPSSPLAPVSRSHQLLVALSQPHAQDFDFFLSPKQQPRNQFYNRRSEDHMLKLLLLLLLLLRPLQLLRFHHHLLLHLPQSQRDVSVSSAGYGD